MRNTPSILAQPWAWGAFDESGTPAGLALLFQHHDRNTLAELLSLFVAPRHRRRGVGTAMLAALEALVQNEGASGLRTTYTTGKSYQPVVEKMMQRCSWREPFDRIHIFKIKLEDLVGLTRRLRRPRKGFEVGLWHDVSEAEREALRRQPWAPKSLVPDVSGQEYDPRVSMVLRYHGEIVGWAIMVNKTVELGKVEATFVRPDLQRTGALIPMLGRSAEIGWDLGYREALFTGVFDHPKLTKFAYRRIAPFCYSVSKSLGAERHFADGTP
ncbi:MAG: GNAT family N-acetyltransferase [Acidobacteriota bacterium]